MASSPTLSLRLPDEAATLALGRALAAILADAARRASLLLRGDLGSGKTTLVRGLAGALPGGDDAEVASPSFNIVNVYPTRPEVFHVDLYRIPGGDPSVEEHLEAAAENDAIVVVEWAEHLPRDMHPPHRLECDWLPAASGRLCRMSASGERGCAALAALAAVCPDLVDD
ncbi:tRNA (adenosine(37)-N6)-threonylcarbamoyltransferase complex ATPase subunit type 1 TsaE [Desulfovibrio sp. TomC]|uniref:tRNA (adenosine(37)-N6)-threonylcarbamoyltransferase complex ATPase subunit type 1 TsaE n=1 Tax=Desulfovibrio sp. TomC TaxID=1562888 RepID=UPI000573C56F|nr:tRNA (adenosine(37)-N6)-threonylcarbamoyltransferase complex ATPase subunit type 1 TsaE [Desulfovibrio sp. TomC]KHK01519.1 TsaE protein, required for threonylcarbamoyladenosine t(6)A37 formation in tRNA [Desulfovibrio sp. TomC]